MLNRPRPKDTGPHRNRHQQYDRGVVENIRIATQSRNTCSTVKQQFCEGAYYLKLLKYKQDRYSLYL